MTSQSEAMLYRRKKGIKVITIHGDTYNRLRDLSKIPDSFNSVISRLLDFYELSNNKNLLGLQKVSSPEASQAVEIQAAPSKEVRFS